MDKFSMVTRERLFTPGPTPLLPQVERAALFPVGYHRTHFFRELTMECKRQLAAVMGTKELPVILACSGSGAMQATVESLVSVGSKVLVVEAGKFGQRWRDICYRLGLEVNVFQLPWGQALDMAHFEQYLVEVLREGSLEAVLCQGTETSTATQYPIAEMARLVSERSSDTLFLVDGISSVGSKPYYADEWGIDAVVSASQKGFGVPPGLGFVGLSQRARQRLVSGPSLYFDLKQEVCSQQDGTTAYTAATQLIYMLHTALQQLQDMGWETVYQVQAQAGQGLRQAGERLGLEIFSQAPAESVTAFVAPAGVDALDLVAYMKKVYKMQISGGQGPVKGKIFRVAHMGAVDAVDVAGCILAMESSLRQLGYQIDVFPGAAVSTFWQVMHDF
ncbi:MAG: alanine--glyoxylate aminotransferase family protein [Zetaproteobacteria bacterium]|nr:alanine--glyoxylate aminotransferase family protein [Zetaproteobacteria bacterium]